MIYWRIEPVRAEPADNFFGAEIRRLRAAGVAHREESAEQNAARNKVGEAEMHLIVLFSNNVEAQARAKIELFIFVNPEFYESQYAE